MSFKASSRQFLAYQFIYLAQRGRYVDALERASRLAVEKDLIDLILSLVPESEKKNLEDMMKRQPVYVEPIRDVEMEIIEPVQEASVSHEQPADSTAEPSYLAMEYVQVEAESEDEVIEISSDSDVIMVNESEEDQLSSHADTMSISSSVQILDSEIEMGSPILDREDLPSLLVDDDMEEAVRASPTIETEVLPNLLEDDSEAEPEKEILEDEIMNEDTGNVTEVETAPEPISKSSPLKEIRVESPRKSPRRNEQERQVSPERSIANVDSPRKSPRRKDKEQVSPPRPTQGADSPRKSPRRKDKEQEKPVSPPRPLTNIVPPLINMSPFSPPLLRMVSQIYS